MALEQRITYTPFFASPAYAPEEDLLNADPMYLERIVEDMQVVTRLLTFGQGLCNQIEDINIRICQEISLGLQGRAQLCLGRQWLKHKQPLPAQTLLTLPVQFGNLVYGILCISADPLHPELPAISQFMSRLVAQVCGWLLYTLEQSAFIQGQCQGLDYNVNGPLTKREREVLALMCRGHSQEAIAAQLCISPATVGKHRQHIYEQLGVHCESDALLVAYRTGLFSLLEEDLF